MEESCNWKVTNIYIYLTKNTIDKQKLAAKINLTVKLMKKKNVQISTISGKTRETYLVSKRAFGSFKKSTTKNFKKLSVSVP